MPQTIVYLHGFRSSPASIKAKQLESAIASLPELLRPRLYIPELVPEPAAAVRSVIQWIERGIKMPAAMVTLVGSSLGGYYATHLAERFGCRAIVINPTIRPYEDLAPHEGTQTNLHTGETFEVKPVHFTQLRAMKVQKITRPARYFLLVRSGDELLDWRESAAFYAGAHQFVLGGGDHGWTDFTPEVRSILRFAGVAAAR